MILRHLSCFRRVVIQLTQISWLALLIRDVLVIALILSEHGYYTQAFNAPEQPWFVKHNLCIVRNHIYITRLHNLSSVLGNPLHLSVCVSCGFIIEVDVPVSLFLTVTILSSIGRWNATGKLAVGRTLTTPQWTPGVSVHRLTLPHGWNPLLLTRWPSRPRAAPHICDVPTQTRTWHQSPCLDGPGRSALRCDAGQCALPTHIPKFLNRHKTASTKTHFTITEAWLCFLSWPKFPLACPELFQFRCKHMYEYIAN